MVSGHHGRARPRARVTPALLTALLAASSGCLLPDDALVPPTADQDPALPQVQLTVAGHPRAVHLRTFGDPGAPALLVLHGSLADHRALLPFQALSDRYFVVLWDQRGSGLSERITADEYHWDAIVDEIAAVHDLVSPSAPATLLGHSFGAMFAVLYTSFHPERVQQLVLMEPAGLTGAIFQETFGELVNIELFAPGLSAMFWQNEVLTPSSHARLDYRALMVLLDGSQTNYFCDASAPPHLPVWRPGAYVEYVRGVRMGAGGLGAPRFDYDFAAGIHAWPGEALIIAGACSALGPAFQRTHHLALFQHAEVVEIESAGHRMFVERFDEVLELIRGRLHAYR
jgi:proline iminopeptidase